MSSFFSIGAEERLGKKNQLLKLKSLIDWEGLRVYLKGIHKNDIHDQGGQRAYDSVKMLKALLLGQWHNLSDPKLEESLRVRLDFMLFTGFELSEVFPDETTLCRFRNKLIEKGLYKKIFKKINHQLESHGLHIESAKGAIVDATVIESAAHPRRTIHVSIDRQEASSTDHYRVAESVDPDARWLKKGKKYYFGYKGFVRVSDADGFIQASHVSPANTAEVNQLEKSIIDLPPHKDLYADKAYASQTNHALLKNRKLKNRVMLKAARNRPLMHWQKVFNKLVSKRRFLVEQGFGTLKRKFQMQRASYMTQEKVEAQLCLKAICFNLLKAVNKVKYA
jgi:IS5 family transposase